MSTLPILLRQKLSKLIFLNFKLNLHIHMGTLAHAPKAIHHCYKKYSLTFVTRRKDSTIETKCNVSIAINWFIKYR